MQHTHLVQPTPPAPAGRTLAGAFRNAHGQRGYTLYVPGGYQGRPLPLLVMLHGCTQDPDDFAAATRMNDLAERDTFLVLYPEQAETAQARRCWRWFEPEHQERGRGEPAILAGLTRRVLRDHAVDPTRVYVAGLSAGGAMAVVLGATYPDLFAAVGVHSGLPYKAGEGPVSAWLAMRLGAPAIASGQAPAGARGVPLIVFHGDADRTVSLDNAGQLVAQWASRFGLGDGSPPARLVEPTFVRRRTVPGGHAYTQSVYRRGDRTVIEQWTVHGLAHAWSGGGPGGSYADPLGPDASAELVRFFGRHRLAQPRQRAAAARLPRPPHHRAA